VLGGNTPASVNSPISDPLVREIRSKNEISKSSAKKQYLTEFKVNDYVYIDFPSTPFAKQSYDVKRGMVYVIAEVDTTSKPYMYKLKELDNTPVKKKLYSWNLLKAGDPNTELLPVQSWSKKRTVNGKVEYFVKWENYPAKYSSWVSAALLKK
jgi:hypothetical protein